MSGRWTNARKNPKIPKPTLMNNNTSNTLFRCELFRQQPQQEHKQQQQRCRQDAFLLVLSSSCFLSCCFPSWLFLCLMFCLSIFMRKSFFFFFWDSSSALCLRMIRRPQHDRAQQPSGWFSMCVGNFRQYIALDNPIVPTITDTNVAKATKNQFSMMRIVAFMPRFVNALSRVEMKWNVPVFSSWIKPALK